MKQTSTFNIGFVDEQIPLDQTNLSTTRLYTHIQNLAFHGFMSKYPIGHQHTPIMLTSAVKSSDIRQTKILKWSELGHTNLMG
jgi:hypothetical protein